MCNLFAQVGGAQDCGHGRLYAFSWEAAMKFGDKLKEQRVRRGLMQDEFAKAIGVARRTLCYYEQGRTHPQNREVYKKLADFFELDVNYFLTEDEEFLTEAAEKYGRRGLSQAEAVLEQAAALFAGGDLSDDDKQAFISEIQELYFDSKLRAKKFAPKKTRK
jgi:transcriptional regulator with XRE-family HTH domain